MVASLTRREPGRALPEAGPLILRPISLFGCCSSFAWLACVGLWPCDRIGWIGRLLGFRSLTAEEHHAARQHEQERHHQKGENLCIGHLTDCVVLWVRAGTFST